MIPARTARAWLGAGLLASLPWLLLYRLHWLPLVAVVATLAWPPWRFERSVDPGASLLVTLSAVGALALGGGPRTALIWLLLGVVALGAEICFDALGLQAGWRRSMTLLPWLLAGVLLALAPRLIHPLAGGLVAPALLLVLARRGAEGWRVARIREAAVVQPPIEQPEGRLCFDGLVLADRRGDAVSTPLDLEIPAGTTIALLADDPELIEALVETLSGRRLARRGRALIDDRSLEEMRRPLTVIAPGEELLPASLQENIHALRHEPLSPDEETAVREAFEIADLEAELGGRDLERDGSPLSSLSRLFLMAARVMVSHYRMVVLVDPVPWSGAMRADLWRAAAVRASLGRTAIWITTDRGLAERASACYRFDRHGFEAVV